MDILKLPNEIIYNIFLNIKNLKQYSYLSKDVKYLIESFYDYYYNNFNNLVKNWQYNLEDLIEKLINKDDENSLDFLLNNYRNHKDLLYSIAYVAIVNKNKYWLNFVQNRININISIILFHLAKHNKIKEIIKLLAVSNNSHNSHTYYEEIAKGAAAGGHVKLLNDAIDNYHLNNIEDYALIALRYNNLNVLNYILENFRFEIDANVIAREAIKQGNNKAIEMLRKYSLDISESIPFAVLYDDVQFFTGIKLTNRYVNNIIKSVINSNSIKVFNYLIKTYRLNYNDIGLYAAEENNADMVMETIIHGANNFNEMAKYAAYNKNNSLVLKLVELGANNLNELAEIAIKTYNNVLLDELIDTGKGIDNFHELISLSLQYKNYEAEDIIDKILLR